MVEWYWLGKAKALVKTPVPLPLCPPQVSHCLAWNETPAFALIARRLKTMAVAQRAWEGRNQHVDLIQYGIIFISVSVSEFTGPGERSRFSDSLGGGRSGDRNPVVEKSFASVQTNTKTNPTSCKTGTVTLSLGWSGQGAVLYMSFHLFHA